MCVCYCGNIEYYCALIRGKRVKLVIQEVLEHLVQLYVCYTNRWWVTPSSIYYMCRAQKDHVDPQERTVRLDHKESQVFLEHKDFLEMMDQK